MAFGAKGKGKPRRSNQQNSLFKRRKFCRFTAEHVEQIDYKDVDTLPFSWMKSRSVSTSRKTARSCRLA